MLETVGPHMQLAAEMLESEPKAAS
jgi:hypothetical protein